LIPVLWQLRELSWDQKKRYSVFAIELTGGISKDSGERVYKQILEKAGLNESNIDYVVSTGYGRENLTFSKKNVTEITCHGAGVHFLFPEVATILDIGVRIVRQSGLMKMDRY
jgi:activator of 2-hydroxyglutaryl-CoA dehydratase